MSGSHSFLGRRPSPKVDQESVRDCFLLMVMNTFEPHWKNQVSVPTAHAQAHTLRRSSCFLVSLPHVPPGCFLWLWHKSNTCTQVLVWDLSLRGSQSKAMVIFILLEAIKFYQDFFSKSFQTCRTYSVGSGTWTESRDLLLLSLQDQPPYSSTPWWRQCEFRHWNLEGKQPGCMVLSPADCGKQQITHSILFPNFVIWKMGKVLIFISKDLINRCL